MTHHHETPPVYLLSSRNFFNRVPQLLEQILRRARAATQEFPREALTARGKYINKAIGLGAG